jgi:long-chain acyl-CoA synthetase
MINIKLENIFSRCPFVAQIFIYGDSMENELVTVIVPDPEHSVKVAIQQGLLPANTPVPGPITPTTTMLPAVIKSLSNNNRFKQLILADLAKVAEQQKLAGFEIPKGVILESESPWSVENGLFTPTMKLKRQSAKEKYENQIKEWYIQRRKDMEEKEAASSIQFVKANL